jgi:predicted transcriptional regulator
VRVEELMTVDEFENKNICESVKTEEIEHITVSDLMSDVLTMEHDNMLLVSALCTDQAMRTADIIGAVAVIITNGKIISDSMIKIAKESDIALFSSKLNNFSVSAKLCRTFTCPGDSVE